MSAHNTATFSWPFKNSPMEFVLFERYHALFFFLFSFRSLNQFGNFYYIGINRIGCNEVLSTFWSGSRVTLQGYGKRPNLEPTIRDTTFCFPQSSFPNYDVRFFGFLVFFVVWKRSKATGKQIDGCPIHVRRRITVYIKFWDWNWHLVPTVHMKSTIMAKRVEPACIFKNVYHHEEALTILERHVAQNLYCFLSKVRDLGNLSRLIGTSWHIKLLRCKFEKIEAVTPVFNFYRVKFLRKFEK